MKKKEAGHINCKNCGHPEFRHFTVEESFFDDDHTVDSCMGTNLNKYSQEVKCDCAKFEP
jgi:hypothetical protein